ncbi:MAG: IPExxxVDY family protein [Flavobacteriaceae bacterium]
MKKQKYHLTLDEVDPKFILAIYSGLPSYRLAFLINTCLFSQLKREKDLDFYRDVKFPYFLFQDEVLQIEYRLIKNKTSQISNQQPIDSNPLNGLFNETASLEETFYVLPEYKEADYLLVLDGEFGDDQLVHIENEVTKLEEVLSAYYIPFENIKSKTHLTF